MAMHPDLLAQMVSGHQRDLLREADRERAARLAGGDRPRFGVWLVRHAVAVLGAAGRATAPTAQPVMNSRKGAPMMSGWQEWPNSPVQRGQSDPRVALDHALRTETAWAREARVILRLAAERGLCLDAQSLLLGDVHDLQALRHELQSQPIPSAHARRAELPRLTRVLAQRSAARAGTTGNS